MSVKVFVDKLDERSRQVLYAVVESYINNPEPVGSRFVTKKYSFGFSSATIRNIMADLEELGFLDQPYISAGRVPTDKGYRFYVDSFADKDPSQHHQDEVLAELICQFAKKLKRMKNDINEMFMEVINTLSIISNYIGVALPPKPEKTTFNRIDLIRYRGEHVAAILLTDNGVIKNKILKIDPKLTQDELNRITDYLNSEYSGYTLNEIKGVLIKRIKQEKALWDDLISKAVKISEQAISFAGNDIFVSGLHDMIDLPDFSDISRFKEMAKAIKDKHLILNLLDELSDTEGVQVIIGNENPVKGLRNLSIVASTYKEGDMPMGVIALIGPRRMDYSRTIYMVDTVTKCINKTFSER